MYERLNLAANHIKSRWNELVIQVGIRETRPK